MALGHLALAERITVATPKLVLAPLGFMTFHERLAIVLFLLRLLNHQGNEGFGIHLILHGAQDPRTTSATSISQHRPGVGSVLATYFFS